MSNTPIQDERNALRAAARELQDALREAAKVGNRLISMLLSEEMSMLNDAHQEMADLGAPKPPPKPILGDMQGQAFETPSPPSAIAVKPKHKRACGLCHKPGHRRDNCPDADKDFKATRKQSKRRRRRA